MIVPVYVAMERTTSQGSIPGSSPLKQAFRDSFYVPKELPAEDSTRFSSFKWALKHFQWVLAVYAAGVLIATSYASRAIYDLGDSFRDIIDVLQLDHSSVHVVDSAVNVAFLVSWLLAGGSIIGANSPPSASSCSLD